MFNPRARRYSPTLEATIVNQAQRILSASHIAVAYTVPQTDGNDVIYDVGALSAQAADCVIAVGGDGTVNAVVSTLMRRGLQRHVALGVLPYGTGNNLVRSFGLARSSDRALQTIRQGYTVSLDVGLLNQRYYCINASFGLFAYLLLHRVTHSRLGYTYEALRHLRVRPWRVRLCYRNAANQMVELPEQRYLLGAMLNTAYYASMLRMAPDAVGDDGLFDIKLIGEASALAYPLIFTALLTGRYGLLRNTVMLRASQVDLFVDPQCRMEVDGDILPAQPAFHLAMAGSIRLLVPERTATGKARVATALFQERRCHSLD